MKKKCVPLLSVITINRNNAEGLRNTINSVLTAFDNSGFDDCEYIIIDGNSTDDSVNVIKNALKTKLGKKFISYWVSESDAGVYNAMNKGIAHSSGLLINMMNSGDELLPYSLNGLRELYKKNPKAILYGGMENTENGQYNGKIYSPLADCLTSCGICHQAIFTPRILHNQYGLYDEKYRICADYDFFAKLYAKKVEFNYIHRLVCAYDMAGISATQTRLRSEESVDIQRKYGFYKKNKVSFAECTKKIIKMICPYGLLVIARRVFKRG